MCSCCCQGYYRDFGECICLWQKSHSGSKIETPAVPNQGGRGPGHCNCASDAQQLRPFHQWKKNPVLLHSRASGNKPRQQPLMETWLAWNIDKPEKTRRLSSTQTESVSDCNLTFAWKMMEPNHLSILRAYLTALPQKLSKNHKSHLFSANLPRVHGSRFVEKESVAGYWIKSWGLDLKHDDIRLRNRIGKAPYPDFAQFFVVRTKVMTPRWHTVRLHLAQFHISLTHDKFQLSSLAVRPEKKARGYILTIADVLGVQCLHAFLG